MLKNFSFFNKDKDLILKITNAVLIIWILGACTVLYVNVSNLIFKEKASSFEIYKTRYCYYEKETSEENTCELDYQNYIYYRDNEDYNNKKQLFIAFGNIIIVKSVLLLLNRKKGKK